MIYDMFPLIEGTTGFNGASFGARISIGSRKPLRAWRPIDVVCRASSSPANLSDINSGSPLVLQTAWMRLTRFTSGPMTVKSRRWPYPILP